MKTIEEIRERIDSLDAQLMPLLKERFECSIKVAEYKTANNVPVLDNSREAAILNKADSAGGKYGENLEAIYKEIMAQSRAVQERNA